MNNSPALVADPFLKVFVHAFIPHSTTRALFDLVEINTAPFRSFAE
ncbi:hypothetical protein DNG97_22125 [Vibrio parahaemolyticus]|nr:hypothetical protein [Vibrio parahaemolyticus]EGQ9478097.1 hypothetical protein [Vibrio parahaemolyticus]EGR0696084.1 hypothetical protein [Vibrio parahaemolyticus]EGR3111264.1 hypothetical protein [Vibrio parahaemolyticus]